MGCDRRPEGSCLDSPILLHALLRTGAFMAAFLLFLVQPMVARAVLPALGGSAQVWSTCVAFFQLMLVAGYAWTHLTLRWLGTSRQALLHSVLLVTGVMFLPWVPGSHGVPAPDASPVAWLLGVLVAHLAIPILAVAATGPLVGHWTAGAGRGRGRGPDPYRPFAAGNVGALLGLIAYPILLEPRLDLQAQTRSWTAGYVMLLGVMLTGALLVRRRDRDLDPVPGSAGPGGVAEDPDVTDLSSRPGRWIALAAIPSSLLLGVTGQISLELPSVPLLWIVPLAIYLVSLVVVFSRPPAPPPRLLLGLHPVLVSVVAIVLFLPLRLPGLLLHLGTFLVTCGILHGELARLRPGRSRLTAYHLAVAVGGALGGSFNALLAPVLFPLPLEYPLGLVLACLLAPPSPAAAGETSGEVRDAAARRERLQRVVETLRNHTGENPGSLPDPGRPLAPPSGAPRVRAADGAGPLALGASIAGLFVLLPVAGDERDVVARVGVLLVAAAVALTFRHRPVRLGLGIGMVMAGGLLGFVLPGTLSCARSAYGCYRVVRNAESGRTVLFHGSTIHGVEGPAGPGEAGRPLAYFHPMSPIGRVMESPRGRTPAGRFGVLGLGIGSLASYVEPGQSMRYFEIDPLVRDLARDPRYFSALAGCRGTCEVAMGDGRLLLASEPDGSFDLLVMDAFSSDAVPTHLLTREAVSLYIRKTAPAGLVMFNTSSRHLDLAGVVAAVGLDLGLTVRTARARQPTPAEDAAGLAAASWVLLARKVEDLDGWISDGDGWAVPPAPDHPAWTDDRSSLLTAIRFRTGPAGTPPR